MSKTITLRSIRIQGIDKTTLRQIEDAAMNWHDPGAGQLVQTFDIRFSQQATNDYALELGAELRDVPRGSVDAQMDALVSAILSLPGSMPPEAEIYDRLAVS